MRRLLALALLLLALALLLIPATAETSDFGDRLAEFNEHYSPFLRAYLGCPKDAREIEECNPKLGSFDYGEFAKARRAAKRLFD